MISAHVKNHLIDFLRGTRSADEARQILALMDESQNKECQGIESQSLVNEFDRLLEDLSPKIPGLSLDLEKLLAGDPIESDPLVSQGNLALLRLDAVYHQSYAAWTKSGADLHRSKRITKAEDPAAYAQRTEKHERTEQNYPPDAQLLNQIVSITLSAFRIQATLTHRRDQLKNPKVPSASSAPPREPNPDLIDHTESLTQQLDDSFRDELKPVEADIALLRGLSKLGPLKGYNPLNQITTDPAPGTADVPVGIPHPASQQQTVYNTTAKSPESRQQEPRQEQPREAGRLTANKLIKVSNANSLSAFSAPPREFIPLAANEPAFHQRE